MDFQAIRPFVPLIFLLFVVFYFLLIRPQQKRQKQRKDMPEHLYCDSCQLKLDMEANYCPECGSPLLDNGKTVSDLINEGALLGMRGEHEASLICINKALKLDPNNALAWHNKGAALEQLNRYEEGLWCLNKAIEIDPDKPKPPPRWRCQQCNAVLEDDEFNRLGWAGHVGSVTCVACGAQHQAEKVHSGYYDIKPKKPRVSGGRSY